MLKAVTFDFWGTLYGLAWARLERISLIIETLTDHGQYSARSDVEKAIAQAWNTLDKAWRIDHRSLGIDPWLGEILRTLGVQLPSEAVATLKKRIEGIYLELDRPLVLQGVADTLAIVASRYRIGLISDVGLTPGRQMRMILDRDGLLQHFDALSFSDEVGVTKPEGLIFINALEQLCVNPAEAVHIGDLPETDVAGASAVGMRTILFLGESQRTDGIGLADAVFDRYEDLPALLASLD